MRGQHSDPQARAQCRIQEAAYDRLVLQNIAFETLQIKEGRFPVKQKSGTLTILGDLKPRTVGFMRNETSDSA